MQTPLNPIIAELLKDLIYAGVVSAIVFALQLIKRAEHALLSKVPANYRPVLESLAHDAVVYVEQFVTVGGGEAKYAAAVQRVIAALQAHGISISLTEIENSIQKAYQDALNAGDVVSAGATGTPTPVSDASQSVAQ